MCILCTYIWYMYDTSSVNTPHGRVGKGPGDLYSWVTQTSLSSFWLIAWNSSFINLTVGQIHHPFQSHAKSNFYQWTIGELQVIHNVVRQRLIGLKNFKSKRTWDLRKYSPNASTETLTSGWNLRYARLSYLLFNDIVTVDSNSNFGLTFLTNCYP